MAQLALPDEPKFSSTDIPAGSPGTWKIPENLYVKDNKWETVAININGTTTDAIAEGNIAITWTPWSKTTCDSSGACASSGTGLVYKLYRFQEPNRVSIRTATPWALVGSGSAYGSSGADKPLDPLAVDGTGARLFTDSTSDGKLITSISNCNTATPGNCTFIDSTAAGNGFSVSNIYNYILVVEDAQGNALTPSVQRYRSPDYGSIIDEKGKVRPAINAEGMGPLYGALKPLNRKVITKPDGTKEITYPTRTKDFILGDGNGNRGCATSQETWNLRDIFMRAPGRDNSYTVNRTLPTDWHKVKNAMNCASCHNSALHGPLNAQVD
ncbi:MAG: hypothetical protein EOO38_32595, partial [Cytophagaceae bacterium]